MFNETMSTAEQLDVNVVNAFVKELSLYAVKVGFFVKIFNLFNIKFKNEEKKKTENKNLIILD